MLFFLSTRRKCRRCCALFRTAVVLAVSRGQQMWCRGKGRCAPSMQGGRWGVWCLFNIHDDPLGQLQDIVPVGKLISSSDQLHQCCVICTLWCFWCRWVCSQRCTGWTVEGLAHNLVGSLCSVSRWRRDGGRFVRKSLIRVSSEIPRSSSLLSRMSGNRWSWPVCSVGKLVRVK